MGRRAYLKELFLDINYVDSSVQLSTRTLFVKYISPFNNLA